MLTKKLKKIAKDCRKAESSVLLTLSTYIDHVVNYLEAAEGDNPQRAAYAVSLAELDLSAVANARQAFEATKETAQQTPDEIAESSDKTEKKSKKAKKRKKSDEGSGAAEPTTTQESTEVAYPAEGNVDAEKKPKKDKKKARKKGE